VLCYGADLESHLNGDVSARADVDGVRGPRLESGRADLDVIPAIRKTLERELAASVADCVGRAPAGMHQGDRRSGNGFTELIDHRAAQRRVRCAGRS